LYTTDVPNAPQYHIAIGDSLYEAGRWDECLAKYTGLGTSEHVYSRMSEARRHLKQYDEAIRLRQQIIVNHPTLAAAQHWQIAHLQEQAGKKEDAIKTLKHICDKFPKTGEGSQAHARLNDFYKIPVTLGGAKD
jgi:tetratricopeptide (TPR) repeat protein